MIKIQPKDKEFGLYIPTNVEEIKAEDLAKVTANINLAKHYAVIALCFNTKLYDFAMTIDKNRKENIGVVPIIAKINAGENGTAFKVGDKVVVDKTTIERGFHVIAHTAIQSNNLARYISTSPDYLKAILAKDSAVIPADVLNSNIVLLEFKIVPLNDIVATIDDNGAEDPFVAPGGETAYEEVKE